MSVVEEEVMERPKKSDTTTTSVNDEIQSIRPYRFRPLLLHLNILPFLLAYLVWFYVWTQQFGVEEFPELGMIVTAVIAILQVVTCLFCYWFVEFRVVMQCARVADRDADKAECVQITPTANNGFAELVYLHHKYKVAESGSHQLDFGAPTQKVTWFTFQKTKYMFDSERKEFKPIVFPVDNHSLQFYLDSKGYSVSDSQVQEAQAYFDLNRMILDIPKFVELFIERATAPFFVFQVEIITIYSHHNSNPF